jgi:FG-GAP-like repeat
MASRPKDSEVVLLRAIVGLLLMIWCRIAVAADVASPSWAPQRTHRLLVRIDPLDIGNRPSEAMVASLHVDFDQYLTGPIDLSTLLVRQFDPETGQVIDRHENAFAKVPGELSARFYDDQIPWMYPDYQGYSDPQTGLALPIRVIPGGGRFFNTIGDSRSGKIAWAHTQLGGEPSYYEISFSELPPGAGQRPPPMGFLGDGGNRCMPRGEAFAPIIHGRLGIGDLSGSGLFDIVLGNGTGTLLWYPNHGQPGKPLFDVCKFLCTEDGHPIDVGWSAAPELVDWDHDGLLDLIVGAEKESILFYKNVGDKHHPVFRLMGPLYADGKPLRVPHAPCDMDPGNKIYPVDYEPVPHVVDWTGNGKLDLMAGGYITGRIFYYENVADSPNDIPKLVYRGPLQADGKDIDVSWCAAPCTGDFRNCGKLDLISGAMQISPVGGDMADPNKFLWYYENIGTRQNPVLHHIRFPAKGKFAFGALGSPRAIDFNGDGKLDLVVACNADLLMIPNIGTSSEPLFDAATPPVLWPWGVSQLPWNTSFIHWNGDLWPDMFDGHRIVLNSGRGSPGLFDKIIPLPGADEIDHPTKHGDPWDERAFADLDGDGKPDILVADNEGHVWFHRNIGTASQPRFDVAGKLLLLTTGEPVKVGIPPAGAAPFDVLQGSRAMLAVLDMNHSGPGDLAISDTYGKIRLFLHDPAQKPGETPRFLAPINLPEPQPHVRLTVRRIDWNRDGWDDLIYAYANDEYYILLNEAGPNGTRQFSAPIKIDVPGCYGDPFISVVDWNHDGDDDLLINQYGYTRLVEQSFIEHGYIPANLLSHESR